MRVGTERAGRRCTAWRATRRLLGLLALATLAGLLGPSCDDSIRPEPPKSGNVTPETYLSVASDSLAPQFYKLALRWLGSDADGHVARYRYRWTCDGEGCPLVPEPSQGDVGWIRTTATADTFTLLVPAGQARWVFEVAAVDDDSLADPTPARQAFTLRNTAPVASFQRGTTPVQTLPAVTFYLDGVDPDSTALPDDHDSRTDMLEFRAWLDTLPGRPRNVHTAPFAAGSITFAPADFDSTYGPRTVYLQVVDDGGAVSATIHWDWEVLRPPPGGILLVDDCRMGGFLEDASDRSYRDVLSQYAAPGSWAVLDIEAIPRLSRADLEATLSLFDRVVWYTGADTKSSGALELARGALDSLVAPGDGHLFLCSGVAFGTKGAFGDQEARFRDFFGIDSLYRAPDGSTNFAFSQVDTIQAGVHSGLTRLWMLSLGLGDIMECFSVRQEVGTDSLYYYPKGTFVRPGADPFHPFVNQVRFDIGVEHVMPRGGCCTYVSFPIGLPINAPPPATDNEVEIREMLRRAGILVR